MAIKTGQFEIAHVLLDRGADVNFMEQSDVNDWRAPVLHDAIRASVMCSRWLAPSAKGWETANTAERADEALDFLSRMFQLGASVDATDSYGSTALERAVLDARQVLPRFRVNDPEWVDEKPLNAELESDLGYIFGLIVVNGAMPYEIFDRHTGLSIAERYRVEPVGRFIEGFRR